MSDNPSIFTGVAATVMLHLLVAGLVVSKTGDSGCGGGPAEATGFENAQVIEASLAFKEVKPKNKQPQKEKKKKFKQRTEDAASKEETLDPKKDKKPETVPLEQDEVDPNYEDFKFKIQDEDLSETGSEEVPVEGAADGSEAWGTEKDAKGDPYAGEVKGRIYSVWKVPALESGDGNAVGCVRLDESGAIVERELKKKSKNTNLDRSVEVALKNATDMDKPVPENLKTLLTVNGICFNFTL